MLSVITWVLCLVALCEDEWASVDALGVVGEFCNPANASDSIPQPT